MLSDDTSNTHFLGLSIILYLQRLSKVSFEVVKQILILFQLHYHIINICLDVSFDLSFQDDLNAPLICSSSVLQVECHLGVAEDSKWSDEHCFFFIVNGEADLMIARIGIQKQH
jgi:hypothetical protein